MNQKVIKSVVFILIFGLAMYLGSVLGKHQLRDKTRRKEAIIEEEKKRKVLKIYIKENLNAIKNNSRSDVTNLITITQPEDIALQRNRFIEFLWGKPGLPSSLPVLVTKGLTDKRYNKISSLSRIDYLRIDMEYGIESHVYHFIPKKPNNQIVLYHQGHGGDFHHSKKQISQLIDNGFSVIAFCMPLIGLNNQPVVHLPRFGEIKFTRHRLIDFLTPKNGHPVKYFIEPVIVVMNYIKEKGDYTSVSMIGISGGGWTTTLAAAIDTRIQKSFPVAGSYPLFLSTVSRTDWGDYEQTVPELYRTVNYLELYILGSHGKNRSQTQIINQYDSCCFSGTKWKTYRSIVEERVQKLGAGEFSIFMDSSHRGHTVSKVAMKEILDRLNKKTD